MRAVGVDSCSHSDPYLTLESLPLLPTAVTGAAVATASGATIRTDYLQVPAILCSSSYYNSRAGSRKFTHHATCVVK